MATANVSNFLELENALTDNGVLKVVVNNDIKFANTISPVGTKILQPKCGLDAVTFTRELFFGDKFFYLDNHVKLVLKNIHIDGKGTPVIGEGAGFQLYDGNDENDGAVLDLRNNSSIDNCVSLSVGGGVAIGNFSVLTMRGNASINKCKAQNSAGISNIGGSVFLRGNSSINECVATSGDGGAIRNLGTIDMCGSSSINCCFANGLGNGVFHEIGLFTMRGNSSICCIIND